MLSVAEELLKRAVLSCADASERCAFAIWARFVSNGQLGAKSSQFCDDSRPDVAGLAASMDE